jgi:SAM-dependent methyltransferase
MNRSGPYFDNSSGKSREQLLQNISYFTEWGGRSWAALTQQALFKIGALEDKRVLEIGSRFGKMTSLFALLGAEVTALETDASVIPAAQETVASWGVGSKVTFLHYDGDLDNCAALKGKQFDLIFSKSVLVLLHSALPKYLRGLEALLGPGGRCIFLENAHGGRCFTLVRYLRHPQWRWSSMEYFRPFHLEMISGIFVIEEVKRSYFPPIYLIMALKRAENSEAHFPEG